MPRDPCICYSLPEGYKSRSKIFWGEPRRVNRKFKSNYMKPLCIDLFCGLGGWTEGFLSEGYEVIGFDIENHVYGEHRYPAQLVLQDVRTIHGSQFKDAAIIVSSSPCQEFSYRAMPWKRAKALGPPELGMELFAQAFRIQREAIEAAGRHIPMIQENVRGAQKYVGKAQWNHGSYYLWGDVPALMPMTTRRIGDGVKAGDRNKGRHNGADGHQWTTHWTHDADAPVQLDGLKTANNNPDGSKANNNPARGVAIGEGIKTVGHVNKRDGHGHTRHLTNQAEHDAVKNGGDWFGCGKDCSAQRRASSGSNARKAATAKIAKIPFPLSQWIARVTRESLERAA